MGITIDESMLYEMGYNKGFKDGIKGSIPKSVLEDIKAETENLKDNRCFCHHYERGINECINVLNKHMESEDNK